MNLSAALLATANQADKPGSLACVGTAGACSGLRRQLMLPWSLPTGTMERRGRSRDRTSPSCRTPGRSPRSRRSRDCRPLGVAGPLSSRAVSSEGLGRSMAERAASGCVGLVGVAAARGPRSLVSVRARHQQLGRIRRLETILEIASQWYQTREIEPLLVSNGRGGNALTESRPSQHLSLGSCQPLLDRPPRLA